MAKRFALNIGYIKMKTSLNMLKNMREALLLASIEASNRAPIDTGRLRTRVRRDINLIGLSGLRGTFTFTQPYAVIQHEHKEFNHPKGGEAKYAEKALRSTKDRLLKILAKGVVS